METFDEVCKAKDLRITHQRTEIFRALIQHTNHPTIENVFNQVRKYLKTISLDTVYRTISTFEEHGLIKRVQLVDNTSRFDINLSVHHHFICLRCKKIKDFYWPDFDQMKLPKSVCDWDYVDFKHVVINGLCSQCKKKRK